VSDFTPDRYENYIRESNSNIVGKGTGLETIGVAADRNGPFGQLYFPQWEVTGFNSRPTS